jgi:hypothetical protein
MPNYSKFLRTALVLCPLLFLFSASASTGGSTPKVSSVSSATAASPAVCSATPDAEILAAVQAKIMADTRFDDQLTHINVSVKRRVVTLSGWAKGPVQVKDLTTFARTTRCVRKVVVKMKNRLKVGCGPGQKPCGDTCIDKTETCNLMTKGG